MGTFEKASLENQGAKLDHRKRRMLKILQGGEENGSGGFLVGWCTSKGRTLSCGRIAATKRFLGRFRRLHNRVTAFANLARQANGGEIK